MAVRAACSHVPRELLEAFGLDASRLIPPGTVESESRGEARSGAAACSWCKSALGSLESGDIWIGGATCDQMRRALELAGRAGGAESYVVGVPKTRTPEAEELFVREVEALAAELARRTGRGLDRDALRRIVEARDRLRAQMRRVRRGLSGSEFTALVHLEERLPAGEMENILDRLPPPAGRPAGIPVLVSGSPTTPGELGWFRLLERAGLDVVADATCTGDRSVDFVVEIAAGEEPLRALARAYFRRPPCLFSRPNDEFYAYAGRLAAGRGARAVVWRSVRGCDICGLEAPRAERLLGLPLLALDMSYADTDSIRVRTRVEAFAERLR